MQKETKKKLNVLTGMQAHRLFTWMEDKKQSPYCPEEYSFMALSIARQATNDLGFTVTPKNIITAAKALGYIKPKPKAVKAPSPATAPATAPDSNVDVADAIKTLTENNATLARAVIHLSRVIGVTPENGLAVIAGTGIKKSSDSLFNL